MKKIFGITGGTGCGKTTALKTIQDGFNGLIMDCDRIYHELLTQDKDAKKKGKKEKEEKS